MKKKTVEFLKLILIFSFGKFKKFTIRFKKIKTLKDMMTVYYAEAKAAPLTGKKVAWITSGGPVEPLIAMDIIPVYPENHGAMIGASKMGGGLCEIAEDMGIERSVLLTPVPIFPARPLMAALSRGCRNPICLFAVTISAVRFSNGTRFRRGISMCLC